VYIILLRVNLEELLVVFIKRIATIMVFPYNFNDATAFIHTLKTLFKCKKVKVKQSHYRSGQAQRFPGS
jgi:hypothetical protein